MSQPPRPGESSVVDDDVAPPPPLHAGEPQPRALVVESDLMAAKFVCEQLEKLGFATETVTTGVQAVIAARRAAPALIVAALQLQDVHGPQLVAWLRSNPEIKDVPVIAIHAASEDALKLAQGGFVAVLKKPLSAAKIRQAVAAAFPVSPCRP